MEKDGVKTVHAESREAWRRWLEVNHQQEKSVWLIIYRKQSQTPSVYYDEAVDEALCFGGSTATQQGRGELLPFAARRSSDKTRSNPPAEAPGPGGRALDVPLCQTRHGERRPARASWKPQLWPRRIFGRISSGGREQGGAPCTLLRLKPGAGRGTGQ